jgi:hypothetical protein
MAMLEQLAQLVGVADQQMVQHIVHMHLVASSEL